MNDNFLVTAVGWLSVAAFGASEKFNTKHIAEGLTCLINIDDDRRQCIPSKPKIIGATPAEPTQFPSQAFLGICGVNLDFRVYCVGSLISPNFVLTHRDCFTGHFISGTKVTLGAYDIAKEKEDSRITYFVQLKQVYYSGDRRGLALIELPENVKYTDRISPISLPDSSLLQSQIEGQSATVCGWGPLPRSLRGRSTVLHYSKFLVPRNELCADRYPHYNSTTDICIADQTMADRAFPDYGSPLILTRDHQMILVGVGAFYFRPPHFVISVFMRVTYYLDWIYETTKIEREN